MAGMWMVVVLSFVALLGTLFNSFILTSMIRYRVLRRKQYAILVSLSFCDIFKVLVILSMILQWTEGDMRFCMATSSLGMTLICITTLHLAMESLNRCFVVASPYNYDTKLTNVKVAAVIAMLWITPVPMTVVIPVFWNKTFHFQSHMFGCQHADQLVHANFYIVLLHIVFFAVPLAVMIVSHGFLFKTACKNAKELRKLRVHRLSIKSPLAVETSYRNAITTMVLSTYSTFVLPSATSKSNDNRCRTISVVSLAGKNLLNLIKTKRSELKASKTIALIFFAFLVCNAPIFSITWAEILLADKNSGVIHAALKEFLVGLAFAQIFVDPIVYFLRLKDFKKCRRRIKRVGSSIIQKTVKNLSRERYVA